MIDTTTEFGARADRRLRAEKIAWLTTVSAAGRPQTAPVWFLYDGDRVVVYSHHKARRLANLEANQAVALNLNADEFGNDVVVLAGQARIARDLPSAADYPEYLAKYADQIEREKSWDGLPGFIEQYSVPLEITGLKLSGY